MTPATANTKAKAQPLTADDLLRLHRESVRGELIRGMLLRKTAAGLEHGAIAINLGSMLRDVLRPARLGRVVGSDAGFRLERDPDTVREPNLALISAARLPLDVRVTGYSEVVPDLVVEIIPPGDRPAAVNDKAPMWLRYGVRLVLLVDPDARTVTVLPAAGPPQTLAADDLLDGGDVLPGFRCAVRDIFDP